MVINTNPQCHWDRIRSPAGEIYRQGRANMKKDFIDFNDMSMEEWDRLYALCEDIIEHKDRYKRVCEGKILATPFFEPSTRTFFSFQSAMIRLGGNYIEFADCSTSSVSKGENLKDTIKTIANYADIIAMRHPVEGAATAAALYSKIPVINAGDGGHLHPTQTLTDLVTIKRKKGTLSGFKIGICGDLLNGRTVHSLIKALSRFKNNEFILISTKELRVPSYIADFLNKHNQKFKEVYSLDDCISELDILYMTRIQRERFSSIEEYNRQANVYKLDTNKLSRARKDLIVMHPLPKVDEITYDADEDKRCIYFEQAEYGMYIRMALIMTLIENNEMKKGEPVGPFMKGKNKCSNEKCITVKEPYLDSLVKVSEGGKTLCAYCDHEIVE